MSEKPAYKRLYHLIKEVWTTDETPEVGKNGEVKFRGFYGEYEVTAGGKTYVVTLNENGKELGIATPYNECIYHLIKALEEKNDGLFDYDENGEKVTYSK